MERLEDCLSPQLEKRTHDVAGAEAHTAEPQDSGTAQETEDDRFDLIVHCMPRRDHVAGPGCQHRAQRLIPQLPSSRLERETVFARVGGRIDGRNICRYPKVCSQRANELLIAVGFLAAQPVVYMPDPQ
jgi:hypothetical protein